MPATAGVGRRRRWAGALAALAFALALQGARPLWEPDEGRYVNVALEMIRLGDWSTPRLHSEVPHYSKPPLTYWAIASSITVFGHNEWAARLPNALAFAGTILLVGFVARRLAPGVAVTAAVVYATSLLPFVAANVVSTDTLLCFFVTLGAAGFVELRFGTGSARFARLALWGGFGLAFLTKGPPGLLVLGALLLFAALHRKSGRPGRRLASVGSLLVFLVLAFGWYLHEIRIHPDLLGYLLGDEVVGRVGSSEFHRNAGLRGFFKAYGSVLLAGMLPWWPLALFRRRDPGAPPAGREQASLIRYWLLIPFAVFALSQSRLPLYLLQLTAPTAVWFALRIGPLERSRRARAWILALVVVLLALKLGGALVSNERDGRRFAAELLERVPYMPTEAVFVETRPRYTLSFYLDREVEAVDLATIQVRPAEPAYRPVAEPLASELARHEGNRVFLVSHPAREAFDRELAALGLRSRNVGSLQEYWIQLEPEPLR